MPDEAPPTTLEEAVSDPPRLPGAPVSRRALIGAGAGIAGLGALLGVGFLIKAEVSGMVVDERQRAAHLLRRAGFAPAASEVDAVVKNGIEVSTEALLHPEQSGDRPSRAATVASSRGSRPTTSTSPTSSSCDAGGWFGWLPPAGPCPRK